MTEAARPPDPSSSHRGGVTAILACRSGIEESTPQLRNLARQSIGDELQVLLVAAKGSVDPTELSGFDGLRIRLVELDEVSSRGRAAGRAIPHADTPWIMLVENHSYLEPDAIERLSRPGDWGERDAARAPVMRTGNPETLRSLAMFSLVYGHCTTPASDRPVAELPHHNSMYRREALAELEDELPDLMENEALLQRRLTAMGWELRMAPDVGAWHVNEARWRRIVSDPFALGLRYGRDRASEWGPARRGLYALALPAIAAVRLADLLGKARRATDVKERALAVTPLLMLVSAMGALGEACGYVGLGPAPDAHFWRDFEEHEFHIHERMAGVPVTDPRLRDLLASLPPEAS